MLGPRASPRAGRPTRWHTVRLVPGSGACTGEEVIHRGIYPHWRLPPHAFSLSVWRVVGGILTCMSKRTFFLAHEIWYSLAKCVCLRSQTFEMETCICSSVCSTIQQMFIDHT